jgi:hypothetical protein
VKQLLLDVDRRDIATQAQAEREAQVPLLHAMVKRVSGR